jgi:phage terminase large subunit-like protein
MTKAGQGKTRALKVVREANIDSVGKDVEVSLPKALIGSPTPRIHSRLNDLPSRGGELIAFAELCGLDLMPWQRFVIEHAHKVKEDQRWASSEICIVAARQQGKSTLLLVRALAGLFLWDEPLQISSAHRLSTALELFRQIVKIIETNDFLKKQVQVIRWAHGSEEIVTITGNRYMVRASNNAARGISRPEVVYMDELSEMKDLDGFASLRYTMMASRNPQVWTFATAGDQESVVLNQLRERGMAAAVGGTDTITYLEWSGYTDDINDERNWVAANPALGHTVHEDNIRAILNDPPHIVQQEVLCRWIHQKDAVIPAISWKECEDESVELDVEKQTWFGLDLSPDRRAGALVAAQKLDNDRFVVKLLRTWENSVSLNDLEMANQIADHFRKYPVEVIAYSKRTATAVAGRLVPAGIPIMDFDGHNYATACDQLLSAITSNRLRHNGNEELTKQMLSAVRLPHGDGGWVIGRRASQTTVCASVASALATFYATRPETEVDILVG